MRFSLPNSRVMVHQLAGPQDRVEVDDEDVAGNDLSVFALCPLETVENGVDIDIQRLFRVFLPGRHQGSAQQAHTLQGTFGAAAQV